MTSGTGNVLGKWTAVFRYFSLGMILLLTAGLSVITALSAFGVLPWLQIEARFGEMALPQAGMALQIGATLFMLGLCFFLPADLRMLRLEESHRSFRIGMDDVRRAYMAAHVQDRDGAFRLASEFDAVRERLVYLRDHPDLRGLEPDVLEVAAQMSEISRDLADTYSRDKVDRARTFLRQRQEEVAAFDEKLAMIYETLDGLKRWNEALNAEEAKREEQLDRLEKDLFALLPDVGFEVDMAQAETPEPEDPGAAGKPNVVSIRNKPQGRTRG